MSATSTHCYYFFLSQRRELNPWPLPYQGNALPLSYVGGFFFTLSRKLNTSKAFRAGDQVRTGDIQLGRLTLYQLSYSRVYNLTNKSDNEIKGVGRAGFEPAKLKTTELQSVLVGRLSISPLYYQNSVRKTTY